MSALKIKYTQIFIDNTFVDSVSGRKFPVVNPSNGQVITQVAEGDMADIDVAVTAARRAFDRKSEWRKLDASQRAVLMNKLADLIERDRVFLSQIEALDSGKTVEVADADITYTIGTLRYYAGWTDKIHGNTIPADGHVFSMTLKEPVGVCGQIIPWNYPLLMLGWKFGPALATGCTIILKPAEQTPLSALHVAALSVEAGFPPGVINVVPGYGPTAGAALSSHNDVDKIAFTGSTQVGKIVMTAAAQSNLKRVTLELGGKSPLVVFDDADVDMAAETAANAIFANHGQNCCAGSRTYVHANIYDEFVTKATTRANAIKVGDPFDKTVHQGPQIDEDQMKSILSFIDSGKSEGARLCAGGNRIGTEGFFVEPTVFADVQDNMTIAKQEIFGPVQCILKFNTFDEVVERANATLYGLAAGIITKDINRAIAFAKQAKAGSLWVNTWDAISGQTPFGGYKQSGFGRELGQDGLDGYLETKTVTIGLQS